MENFEYQEYFLFKEDIINKIIINKIENKVIIRCKNYIYNFENNDDLLIKENNIETIDRLYEFIINLFDENKVFIKEIIINKEMKLIFKIDKEKEYEIILLYNKINNDYFINEIKKLKEEINILKNENIKLNNEIDNLKKLHYKTNPKEIQLLSDITKDSYSCTNLDNTFNAFKSINNKFYLVYTNENKSLIFYDLNEQMIIKEIKNYHNEYITNIRHYLDEKNKRDLIMSISKQDNNIRVWDIKKWECILNITEVNKEGYLLSSCFLSENNQIYIITSNSNYEDDSEPIKIFDFNGNEIKEIKNSCEETYFIDTYYDNILSKNYIITGNKNYVKSYDFINNEIYHKYYDNDNGGHGSLIINSNEEIIKLIDSCDDGNIRIWNFHSGLLLNKIEVTKKCLYSLCLWNNNYLFVGCSDKSIKLIELNNNIIIKSLIGHNEVVLTIKKINHPQYGESLISQGAGDDQIKLWIFKNSYK